MRNGTPLRARRWVRSSTPERLTEARLRRLLAGERLPESLPLQAEPSAAGLKLTIAPFSAPDPVIPGPVRISLAYPSPDGTVTIRHETGPGIEAPAKGWSHTFPSTDPPVAVLVEKPGAGALAGGADTFAVESLQISPEVTMRSTSRRWVCGFFATCLVSMTAMPAIAQEEPEQRIGDVTITASYGFRPVDLSWRLGLMGALLVAPIPLLLRRRRRSSPRRARNA